MTNITKKTSPTISGNQGLKLEEQLIFEQDNPGISGVDFPAVDLSKNHLGGLLSNRRIGLPGLSEPQIMRHYTRLSQKNYAIDAGIFPLGSCTMKHNPRLNEKMARLPGLGDIHPFQPFETIQGALTVIYQLADWLRQLTGMAAVAMPPAAGAHGELCGMMAIRAALDHRGEKRPRVLVPESAHGTNPATAAACGFQVDPIPANAKGTIDLAAFQAKLAPDVAAIMITNPNTCGLFETEIVQIAKDIHKIGGYLYCDGANFNAIVGRVRPGDLGIDCMHINLHKTFSTPHGGGGPGSGPVVLAQSLASFAPVPYIELRAGQYQLVENAKGTNSLGRLKAFHGQMGMFIRALTYILSHGADGLWQVSGDAVLNANYIRACLEKTMSPAFSGTCMHEALFSDNFLADTGVTTLDFAKALIDEGFHPMTVYFPLVVHGAMLVEPTETESLASLDQFIASMEGLAQIAKKQESLDSFKNAPIFTPRRRLDETTAARNPILKWSDQQKTAKSDAT